MRGGHIKLHRKMLESAVWSLSPEARLTWVYLLLMANWKPSTVALKKAGRTVEHTLGRGEALVSTRTLADAAGVSKDTVSRALLAFADLGMVSFKSPLGETGPRIVKVLNYGKYQDDDREVCDRGEDRGEDNQKKVRSKEEKKKTVKQATKRGDEVKLAFFLAKLCVGWMGKALDTFDSNFLAKHVRAGADPVEAAARIWVGMSLLGLRSATQALSKGNAARYATVTRELEAARIELGKRSGVVGGGGSVPGDGQQAEVAPAWVPKIECDFEAMQRAVSLAGCASWAVQDHVSI